MPARPATHLEVALRQTSLKGDSCPASGTVGHRGCPHRFGYHGYAEAKILGTIMLLRLRGRGKIVLTGTSLREVD